MVSVGWVLTVFLGLCFTTLNSGREENCLNPQNFPLPYMVTFTGNLQKGNMIIAKGKTDPTGVIVTFFDSRDKIGRKFGENKYPLFVEWKDNVTRVGYKPTSTDPEVELGRLEKAIDDGKWDIRVRYDGDNKFRVWFRKNQLLLSGPVADASGISNARMTPVERNNTMVTMEYLWTGGTDSSYGVGRNLLIDFPEGQHYIVMLQPYPKKMGDLDPQCEIFIDENPYSAASGNTRTAFYAQWRLAPEGSDFHRTIVFSCWYGTGWSQASETPGYSSDQGMNMWDLELRRTKTTIEPRFYAFDDQLWSISYEPTAGCFGHGVNYKYFYAKNCFEIVAVMED